MRRSDCPVSIFSVKTLLRLDDFFLLQFYFILFYARHRKVSSIRDGSNVIGIESQFR